jgi:hypothetical protein
VTLVRHLVRKEVAILSITLFSEAEQWCLALRDAEREDIVNGVEIVDFSVMNKLITGATKPSGKDGGKLLVTG